MKPEELLSVLHTANRLKDTTRHCWTPGNRHESVADHSWRLALAALAVMLSMSMVGSLAKLEVFSENMRQVKATVESLEAFLEMPALPRDVAGSHRGQGVGGLVRREGGINHVQNCQTHHRLVRRI